MAVISASTSETVTRVGQKNGLLGRRSWWFCWLMLLILSSASCGGEARPGELSFFGLAEACVPSWYPDLVVSPGEIVLSEGEDFGDISFGVEGEAQIGVATTGVTAGDAGGRADDMEFLFGSDIELRGPGTWPIVIVIDPLHDDKRTVRIDQINYTLDGVPYFVEEVFELAIADECE